MPDSTEKYSAPALEKGLDVLELLASEPEGVIKSEIARRLDRTISELFRMLVVLERRGYIFTPEGSDRYALTLKLFKLSHRFPPVRQLGMASADIMRKLAYETWQSCHLSIYYSGVGHVVAQQDPPTDVSFGVRLGVEIDVLNSCSGHVLLAFASDSLRDQMLEQAKVSHPGFSRPAILKVIERVRAQGYEQLESPRTVGTIDIGFPVYDHTGEVVASLAVPYLPSRDADMPAIDAVIAALRAASQDISVGLGFSPVD